MMNSHAPALAGGSNYQSPGTIHPSNTEHPWNLLAPLEMAAKNTWQYL